jgi:hypothetical protein
VITSPGENGSGLVPLSTRVSLDQAKQHVVRGELFVGQQLALLARLEQNRAKDILKRVWVSMAVPFRGVLSAFH